MDKVDLIIPTHNRTDFLKRILDYYQNYDYDFNFIIADSSSGANKMLNKKLVKTYSKLNIKYIDKFAQSMPQHIKFGEMVKYAKNKYVCFCPDDDFIIPKGIKECVDFLEKNPDYSAAHGSYIGFYVYKSLLGKHKLWWQFRYSHQSITSSSPLNRVTFHLKNFYLVLWAVRRTSVVKTCYKEFLKSKIDPYLLIIFGELLPDVLTVVYGKVKRLNTFYGARQYFGSIAYNFASLIDAKNKGKYQLEYKKFKDCLLNNLKRLNIPKEKVSQSIDSAMEIYTKYSFQEHLTNRIYFYLRHYPKFISDGLRLLHATYLFSKKNKDIVGDISSPSSKYYEDFETIRQSILKHSNNNI